MALGGVRPWAALLWSHTLSNVFTCTSALRPQDPRLSSSFLVPLAMHPGGLAVQGPRQPHASLMGHENTHSHGFARGYSVVQADSNAGPPVPQPQVTAASAGMSQAQFHVPRKQGTPVSLLPIPEAPTPLEEEL